MHRSVHKALILPIAVCSSVKNRMGIKSKLLLLVALMVGVVSVVAQRTARQPIIQPTTEPPNLPSTGNTCQVLQGPPGPPGTCSYTEAILVKEVRDISTSLKESVKNLTEELMNALGRIEHTHTHMHNHMCTSGKEHILLRACAMHTPNLVLEVYYLHLASIFYLKACLMMDS